jgi:hypothetical protein
VPGTWLRWSVSVARVIPFTVMLCCVLVSVWVIGLSVQVAFRDMHVFPEMDMGAVFFVQFVAPASHFFLFRDNEHLPFAVMPLFLADSVLFRGQGVSLIAGILLLNALIVGLMIDACRRHARCSSTALGTLAALIAASLFWLIHHENLTWPKQIHMYVSLACSVLAFRVLAGLDDTPAGRETPPTGKALLACGLMTVGTFSFAYGAVAWAAAILLALGLRSPPRIVGVLSLGCIANLALYALFYNTRTLEGPSNPLLGLRMPLALGEYVLHYLSAPLFALIRPVLGRSLATSVSLAVTALGCLGAMAAMLHLVLQRRPAPDRLARFACLLLLFALGTALITAVSRVTFDPLQGHVGRYAVVQILFWIGLALLLTARLAHRTRLYGGSLAVIAVAVVALLVPSQSGLAQWSRNDAEAHWTAVLAVVNGVDDDQQLMGRLYPRRDVLDVVARGLAVRGWSVYAQPQPWWIGRAASSLFVDAPAHRCMGFLDSASDLGRIGNGALVNGWAWDVHAARPPEWIVLLDADGVVRALGRSGLRRADVGKVHRELAGSRTGWRAYAAHPQPQHAYTAHAVLADGASLCRLSGGAPRP